MSKTSLELKPAFDKWEHALHRLVEDASQELGVSSAEVKAMCEPAEYSFKSEANELMSRRGDRLEESEQVEGSESPSKTSEPIFLLGVDMSHHSRRTQFLACAGGVFTFSLLYGYLQELLAVQLLNRQLGLFLATVQFTGYNVWSYVLRTYVYEKQAPRASKAGPPLYIFLGLSLLRAMDLAMTNLAMQYVNYPAKTLMKSSRVVFTMIFGVLITHKRYRILDYAVVFLMVSGLAIFMHADMNSSAVFHPVGIIMLTISLMCDGAISNISEVIMNQFDVGQDEFIFRLNSVALVAISVAATAKGDLHKGLEFLAQPGTYSELELPVEERTWSIPAKLCVIALFSTMGFFGCSCCAAITKTHGALTMSITSTARKATTLFSSFALFDNECTVEHLGGMVLFLSALVFKSLNRSRPPKKQLIPSISGCSDLDMVLDGTNKTKCGFI